MEHFDGILIVLSLGYHCTWIWNLFKWQYHIFTWRELVISEDQGCYRNVTYWEHITITSLHLNLENNYLKVKILYIHLEQISQLCITMIHYNDSSSTVEQRQFGPSMHLFHTLLTPLLNRYPHCSRSAAHNG